MKARSGHFIFDKKVRYKDLAPVFRALFIKFLEDTNQMPDEKENVEVLIEENLRDLKKNRKPEGHNREGFMRMIFPIVPKGVQFYIYTRAKTIETVTAAETISRTLTKHRLKHTVEWDKMILYADKK
jgi:hypothetical protein